MEGEKKGNFEKEDCFVKTMGESVKLSEMGPFQIEAQMIDSASSNAFCTEPK